VYISIIQKQQKKGYPCDKRIPKQNIKKSNTRLSSAERLAGKGRKNTQEITKGCVYTLVYVMYTLLSTVL